MESIFCLIEPIMRIFTRKFLIAFFDRLYRLLTDVRMENLDFIPKDGPLIMALNHMSRIDFPLFCTNGRRDDWAAFIADSYRSWPILRQVVKDSEMIWIDRSKADFTAFKKALDWLKAGNLFILAPEGTRSRTGQLIEGKQGIVMLAQKSGVPVCTGSITGTEDFLNDFKHFRKPKIEIYFTPPVVMDPIDMADREASMQRGTDELMCRIASMLPESYRGHYKSYPRVQELIAEWKNTPGLKLPESV